MSSYIGWIPNYGGMITFPKGLVDGFEGGCVSGGIQGVELSVDGDDIVINVGNRRVASLVSLDGYGLCRMVAE